MLEKWIWMTWSGSCACAWCAFQVYWCMASCCCNFAEAVCACDCCHSRSATTSLCGTRETHYYGNHLCVDHNAGATLTSLLQGYVAWSQSVLGRRPSNSSCEAGLHKWCQKQPCIISDQEAHWLCGKVAGKLIFIGKRGVKQVGLNELHMSWSWTAGFAFRGPIRTRTCALQHIVFTCSWERLRVGRMPVMVLATQNTQSNARACKVWSGKCV